MSLDGVMAALGRNDRDVYEIILGKRCNAERQLTIVVEKMT